METLNLIGVKTNNCIYVSNAKNTGNSHHDDSMGGYYFDGIKGEKSFMHGWVSIKSVPEKITIKQNRPNINYRYELVEDAPGRDVLPFSMPREEVLVDSGDGCVWRENLRHLQSLYELKSDAQEPEEREVPLTYKEIIHVGEIRNVNFGYDVYRSHWTHEGTRKIQEPDINRQVFDRVIFPPIMLPELPCKFDSKTMYDIVRYHVKQNINMSVARITSDYDFCFTVKKIIGLSQPYTKKKEILTASGKSYKNKKYREHFVKNREVEVFEMTYSPKGYGGYTPISAIEANNETELKEKVDAYLKDLMDIINEPLAECQHCNGMGIIGVNK